MNIVRWDPLRELEGLRARLNRMVGERPLRGVEGENLPGCRGGLATCAVSGGTP